MLEGPKHGIGQPQTGLGTRMKTTKYCIKDPRKGGCWPLALWLLRRAAAAASVDSVAVAAAQRFSAAIWVVV